MIKSLIFKLRTGTYILFLKIALCLIVTLAIPGSILGFVKEVGMGNIGVAYPQSALAARYNPACVVEMGNRIDFSLGTSLVHGHVTVAGSSVPELNQKASTTQARWFPASLFGVVKMLSKNAAVSFNGDLGITSSVGTIGHTFEPFGTGHFGANSLIGIPELTFSMKLNCRHSVGITLPVYISRLKINGFQNSAADSLYPNNVSNKGFDWAYGVGVKFGWLWHVTDTFNFGIAFNSQPLASSHTHKYKGFCPLKGNFSNLPIFILE